LLSFAEVRDRLLLKQIIDRGVQEIPLDRIVGSVGREREFTRAFLPREEALRQRWQGVNDLAEGQVGFPTIEVYYVNDIYFVIDGHHRVSVARSHEAPTIEARVKEFISPVTLSPNSTIEEIILKSGLAAFLETTGIEQEYLGQYEVTIPNGYERLLDHISVHRYYRGLDTKQDVTLNDALISWKETVYKPMIEAIRKSGILEEFPEKTETDLYLYVMDHLHHLRQRYGIADQERDKVVRDFALSGKRKKGKKNLEKKQKTEPDK
jgi:putative ubiquitin-RnfH superfamily antitoxin RatB of RatAB toxin-antitoxin module